MLTPASTTTNTSWLFVLLITALVADTACASTDPSLPYTAFQQISIQVDENDSHSLLPMAPDDDLLPTVMASQLYDEGCLVSSHAMMISGGDSFFGNRGLDITITNLEDEDSDDDDDNDGHSSMLSNASLRKSKVSVTSSASVETRHFNGQADSPSPSKSSAAFRSVNVALAVRGGASTDLGSDFTKKLLVAAIVTLGYEAIIGHMLEFVKIVMQTAPDGTSYFDVFKLITSEKGISGIWDGFVPWGVVQAVFKGGVFGLAHAIALSILLPLADKRRLPHQLALTLAGGIGGGFQGYVLSPTLLLKTRVMTNPVFRENMSLWKTSLLSLRIGVDVVQKEGLTALMKGSNIFATKRVFDWATRFFFADVCEAVLRGQKGGAPLSATDKIVSSFVGGTLSTLSTLPLDVLVAKTQDAKKAGVKVSALTLFQEELQEKGWNGLCHSYMRGFEVRLLHVCFTTVVMKTGTALVYDALYGNKSV